MDPISQGALGAVAAQNTATNKQLLAATLTGVIGGMAPDLDIFIRSDEDPLLFLEFHRQFTHSLIFIPIGGFICALFVFTLAKLCRVNTLDFKQTLLFATAGYATHALLDSCTSYGTQLFWPFSNHRVAWSNMSIVDPLFTIPIVGLIITACIKRNRKYARWAAVWIGFYIVFGFVQNYRAESIAWEIARARGHEPVRLEAKPGFANLLLWKVVYETKDHFYVDGVRTGVYRKHYEGESIPKLNVARDFPWLDPSSQQAEDIKRFQWFSDGFVSVHPTNPNRIIDVRYSMLPNQIEALWMIELDANKSNSSHVGYAHEHNAPDEALPILCNMLLGRPAYANKKPCA